MSFFGVAVWGRGLPFLPAPKISSTRQKPAGARTRRHVTAVVAFRLVTIHPNPGPRDKTAEGKAARRERRKEARKRKRGANAVSANARGEQQEKKALVVVAWNVQGMSMAARRRRKMREVAEYAKEEEVGCGAAERSEVRGNGGGVVGEG